MNGLSSHIDQWSLPDLTIDEVNGLLQELTAFPKTFVGKLIQNMLIEKLNDNLVTIRTDRNLTDEDCRMRVSAANSKVDLLVLLSKEGLGLIDALRQKQIELSENK